MKKPRSPCKALWIQTAERKITEVTYTGLSDLQRMVGGNIELAMRLKWEDVLFVDDEGLHKYQDFFVVPDGHQPFAGNGVIVGKEYHNSPMTRDPQTTLAEIQAVIRWHNRSEIQRTIGHG